MATVAASVSIGSSRRSSDTLHEKQLLQQTHTLQQTQGLRRSAGTAGVRLRARCVRALQTSTTAVIIIKDTLT